MLYLTEPLRKAWAKAPDESDVAERWADWLHKDKSRPPYLYHLTERKHLDSIRKHGLRQSDSTDLGRGVYFFSDPGDAQDHAFDEGYANPVILRIRTPADAAHAAEVIRRGEVRHEARPDVDRFDAMWIVKRGVREPFVALDADLKPLDAKRGPFVGPRGGLWADPAHRISWKKSIYVVESLTKSAGPYLGPRGGKWADARHTIPWRPEQAKAEYKVAAEHLQASADLDDALGSFGDKDEVLYTHHGEVKAGDVRRMLESWRPKKPDSDKTVTVYHSTDRATADRMLREGVIPASKPMTLARERYEQGEYAEYQPGAGVSGGLYVGGDKRDTSGYGRVTLAISVPRDWLHASPEQVALGETDPDKALQAHDGAVIHEAVHPSQIREVSMDDKDELGKSQLYIGPRGGRWADPAHKIPYRPGEVRYSPGERELQVLLRKVKRREPGKGGELKLNHRELVMVLNSGRFALVSAGPNPNVEADRGMSAERQRERHEQLRAKLVAAGYQYTQVTGHYGGREDSFLVMMHDAERGDARELGKVFNQDSVIYSAAGRHTVYFTHGDAVGQCSDGRGWSEKPKARDFFSVVRHPDGTRTRFSLNINFDKRHPCGDAEKSFAYLTEPLERFPYLTEPS